MKDSLEQRLMQIMLESEDDRQIRERLSALGESIRETREEILAESERQERWLHGG
jgi:hypothetical protein